MLTLAKGSTLGSDFLTSKICNKCMHVQGFKRTETNYTFAHTLGNTCNP